MFKWLVNIFLYIISFWEKLPEETKKKIIDLFLVSFEILVRKFYKKYKEEENKKEKNKENL